MIPMSLPQMPRIDRLTLSTVSRVPEWHPEHATFQPFPVHAWVVHHPDGLVLFDTGTGVGNARINDWYGDDITPLDDALATIGVATNDIVAVVLSHLHFDHCGQQNALDAPAYVQAAEHAAAQAPRYTIPEWAAIPDDRLRMIDGDVDLARGLRILSTPGHTPGHQSLVIEGRSKRIVLGGQCAFKADELRSGEPAETNLPDPAGRDAARASLARIRSVHAQEIHLSHDPEIVTL